MGYENSGSEESTEGTLLQLQSDLLKKVKIDDDEDVENIKPSAAVTKKSSK
jgi:hypothetical protein